MFNKVLVPLDGSNITGLILPYVTQLAGGMDIPILLLSVIEYPDSGEGVSYRSDLVGMMEDTARRRLREVVDRIAGHGVHVESTVVIGKPVEKIIDTARLQGCDLIAMSTHGQNAQGPGVLGSVTDRLVHTSQIPVLAVAPARADMYAAYEAVRRTLARITGSGLTDVLAPLDGSQLAETALPYVEELARRLSLKITLMRVVKRMGGPWMEGDSDESDIEQQKAEARAAEYLEAIAERLRSRGLKVFSQVETGSPVRAIMNLARHIRPDFIALATRGHARWTLGSVAEALVRGTGDPILVVSPQADPGETA